MTADRDDLVRRLNAGEQLTVGEIAVVLRVSRRTVQYMINDGRLRSRMHGGGKLRIVDMASVREHLAAVSEDLPAPKPAKHPEQAPVSPPAGPSSQGGASGVSGV